jgi:thiamine-phosphate pyrophosphorylase
VPLPTRPFLYPIVDVDRLRGRAPGAVVTALVRGGVRLLQFRGKNLTDREFVKLAREAVAAAHAGGALLLVNDRPDVARILKADGVHLGQEDLTPRDARALLPPPSLVGLSTHDRTQVEAAKGEGVDYVAVGPVFSTGSKADPEPVVGLSLVAEARRLIECPLVAIGGITLGNAAQAMGAGADGVAVISGLLDSPDLEAAAREFRRVIAT